MGWWDDPRKKRAIAHYTIQFFSCAFHEKKGKCKLCYYFSLSFGFGSFPFFWGWFLVMMVENSWGLQFSWIFCLTNDLTWHFNFSCIFPLCYLIMTWRSIKLTWLKFQSVLKRSKIIAFVVVDYSETAV